MLNKTLLLAVVFLTTNGIAQKKIDVTAEKVLQIIKDETTEIVVERSNEVEIVNQNVLRNSSSEVNFVMNEQALRSLDFSVFYDKLNKIKSLELKVYDGKGVLVKTFKQKDFKDTSIADGFSIFTDDRKKTLNLDYYNYPFFTKFDYETEQKNTVSIPSFNPIKGSAEQVLNATYTLIFPQDYTITKWEQSLTNFEIVAESNPGKIVYKAQNLVAPEYEELNIHYSNLIPSVRFANNTLALDGVRGVVNSWDDFGVWYHKSFLEYLDELPKETVSKMKSLTQNAKTNIEKAKIIFDYVQNNTRYISVQVGVGGWQPFPAKEVDKLGYGDCKALTNYTKALLNCVGVEAYYTVIYASNSITDIDENIISLQGNHVILTLPTKEGMIFLESTSQKIPFGYLGTSTDNRQALMIRPDGAEFVKTHSNKELENNLTATFKVDLSNLNRTQTKVTFNNRGSFYNAIFGINPENQLEVERYLKNVFSNLKDIKIADYDFNNDKNAFVYYEKINLESGFIGANMGKDYMVSINPFLNLISTPKRYRNRKTGFGISRGKSYEIATEFLIPEGFQVTFKPDSKTIHSKFGSHSLDVHQEGQKIIVKETFVLNSGDYSKEEYQEYRDFTIEVLLNNNAKFIFTKN